MTKEEREVMCMALEALKSSMYPQPQQFRAITAIDKCLENDAVDCEPVVWMYQNKSTHEVRFQKYMRTFVDHSAWYEIPLYSEPLANQEKTSGSPIKEALAHPWEKFCDSNCVWTDHHPDCKLAQRKPLTDEEIANTLTGYRLSDAIDITRAIEAAHGIVE